MSDEIHALQRRRVEPVPEPACQLGRRKLRSEPWQVGHVHAVALGQQLEDRAPPAPRAGQPVYEDHRFALAVDPIVDRCPVDHEPPNLHDDQFGRRRHTSGEKTRAERAIVFSVADTKRTKQDQDAISRLADAGEDALRRLVDLPRRAAVGAMHRLGERLDDVATKLRTVDPLSRRVTALEKRLDSLQRPNKAPARRASTRAKPSTARQASKPAAAVESEQAEHPAQPAREGERAP